MKNLKYLSCAIAICAIAGANVWIATASSQKVSTLNLSDVEFVADGFGEPNFGDFLAWVEVNRAKQAQIGDDGKAYYWIQEQCLPVDNRPTFFCSPKHSTRTVCIIVG